MILNIVHCGPLETPEFKSKIILFFFILVLVCIFPFIDKHNIHMVSTLYKTKEKAKHSAFSPNTALAVPQITWSKI
jgi:hypothetical protein